MVSWSSALLSVNPAQPFSNPRCLAQPPLVRSRGPAHSTFASTRCHVPPACTEVEMEPMRLVIDARMLEHSGIGTYLTHALPGVLRRCATLRPLVLTLPMLVPSAGRDRGHARRRARLERAAAHRR
jgi:hypothetical protein